MKKDINEDRFLAKWLSGDLSNEELKGFEASKDYLAYKDIIKGVERLDRPVFDVEKKLKEQKAYNTIYKQNQKTKVIKPITWIYSAAAVILVLIGVRALFFEATTTIQTKMAKKQEVTLPDSSIVTLNADTSLKYNKSSFIESRVLHLKGEAFFDVAKGSSFTVNTTNGTITVLGTEFDVYSRNQTLKVQCFEGKVSVEKEGNQVILTSGKGAKSDHKEKLSVFEFLNLKPDWLDGKSSFSEVPLKLLIKELERQYDIKINIGNVDTQRVFTGFFIHNNLKVALRTSFDPMNISYTFETERIISLKNK